MVPVAMGTDQTPSKQNWYHLHLDATPVNQMQDIFILVKSIRRLLAKHKNGHWGSLVIGNKLHNQIFVTDIWDYFYTLFLHFFAWWQHLTGCVGRSGLLLAERKKSE